MGAHTLGRSQPGVVGAPGHHLAEALRVDVRRLVPPVRGQPVAQRPARNITPGTWHAVVLSRPSRPPWRRSARRAAARCTPHAHGPDAKVVRPRDGRCWVSASSRARARTCTAASRRRWCPQCPTRRGKGPATAARCRAAASAPRRRCPPRRWSPARGAPAGASQAWREQRTAGRRSTCLLGRLSLSPLPFERLGVNVGRADGEGHLEGLWLPGVGCPQRPGEP